MSEAHYIKKGKSEFISFNEKDGSLTIRKNQITAIKTTKYQNCKDKNGNIIEITEMIIYYNQDNSIRIQGNPKIIDSLTCELKEENVICVNCISALEKTPPKGPKIHSMRF